MPAQITYLTKATPETRNGESGYALEWSLQPEGDQTSPDFWPQATLDMMRSVSPPAHLAAINAALEAGNEPTPAASG